MLLLMAEAREVSNPELKERYNLTITGDDRKRLNDLKLVESWVRSRSYAHVLTDAGWARAAELFRDGVPSSPRPAGRALEAALRALAAGLHRHLRQTRTSLGEFFALDETGIDDEIDAEIAETDTGEGGPDVESRIREAYRRLADGPNAWVSLTRLRPLLGDASPEEVDGTLRRMIGMPDVHLIPETNQKTLTDEDRRAAVTIGDQPKHLILIGA
ncbi:hypothetical protein MPTA5024_34800 [Microbispora sp. ATCC PTA-5024]|nr:hypothetical protein MPTA5024_34800 [Microbispora sp. ATCC PTA-5024]